MLIRVFSRKALKVISCQHMLAGKIVKTRPQAFAQMAEKHPRDVGCV